MVSLLQHANTCVYLITASHSALYVQNLRDKRSAPIDFKFLCPFLLYIHRKIGRPHVTHAHTHWTLCQPSGCGAWLCNLATNKTSL